jgi:hypothetical protein
MWYTIKYYPFDIVQKCFTTFVYFIIQIIFWSLIYMFVSFNHQAFEYKGLQNYKQLMPPVHPKGIDNYKIFNNAPKFHYQHCISMYKFIILYLGVIFQFTHDLSHKFIIDLLVLCHFLFIDSINLPRKCDNQVLVNRLVCTSM